MDEIDLEEELLDIIFDDQTSLITNDYYELLIKEDTFYYDYKRSQPIRTLTFRYSESYGLPINKFLSGWLGMMNNKDIHSTPLQEGIRNGS